MASLRSFLQLPASLLLCASVLPHLGSASSQVDVSLEASFPAPPLLLELLESAATENSTSYFPILSSIASGALSTATSDEDLYHQFEELLFRDGHITDRAALASWRMSLAVHEAAPRIEAQYELWRSTVQPSYQDQSVPQADVIEVWTPDNGLCLDARCEGPGVWSGASTKLSKSSFEFDKTSGDAIQQPWTLIVDPTSPHFGNLYTKWSDRFRRTGQSFRVRYKPGPQPSLKPLVVNGYGVELTLKRTDYIVIDDREAEDGKANTPSTAEIKLDGGEVADVKPLSSSELRDLGLNAASFILANSQPFETLIKVSQDFPKHAAALALHNASESFVTEHRSNRNHFLPHGYNIIWINGAQADPREIDAFALLDLLRKERKLVNSIQSLGLTPSEAINVLSHRIIGETQAQDQPQRYDYRDDVEGGKVISWMNDIEKDKRYQQWPASNQALLQRLFPGQLPSIKKNMHSLVYPVDLSDRQDVMTVIDTLQSLVKRLVPVRFGLVPLLADEVASAHAKVFYYLTDTYGLAATLDYLTESLPGSRPAAPSEKIFAKIVEDRRVRPGRSVLSLKEVLGSEALGRQLEAAQSYASRLGLTGRSSPLLCNGIAVPRVEEWLQIVSQRIGADVRTIQEAVYTGKVEDDAWLPELYMKDASMKRNSLIIPETESDVKIIDLAELHREHDSFLSDLRAFRSMDKTATPDEASLLILADFNDKRSQQLVVESLKFAMDHQDVAVTYIHQSPADRTTFSVDTLTQIQELLSLEETSLNQEQKDKTGKFLTGSLMSQSVVLGERESERRALSAALNVAPHESAVLLNGRVIGPLASDETLSADDFETLLGYETKKRVQPVVQAVQDLDLQAKLSAELSIAKLSSLIALAVISDVPEGIFDTERGPRMSMFSEWASEHSSIKRGVKEESAVHVTASVDPTSETAQRWIPILDVFSQMDGVYVELFLNPREKLQELPTKRFYRQVLKAKPSFEERQLVDGSAEFDGIPRDALLTMALDIPPAWLVGAKESIHDPDNIKLSSLTPGTSVKVIYELQNILIEGHSRDTTMGNPPRGAQLILSTGSNADLAGTIVMANLGYFQFRANPGVYDIALKQGASQNIFQLDSVGSSNGAEGENNTQVALASFKGTTLFPKVSRKAGMEAYDVLDYDTLSVADIAGKGIRVADELLAKVGLPHIKTGQLLDQALEFGRKALGQAGVDTSAILPSKKHADINIFSVASGHLYERMLNIMMLSVMKHTEHTVKFWFIEQFLSPSFKQSIPVLAQKFGFDYEMVTYKWPHWLREQKEKQRTIWGYKILFLDVLFPLDLDKVIFVDADQIVRTDMYELVQHDLEGAAYGFTPMCDSRTEMEGFRFWKQGYWKSFLRGKPYHISALYVVDLTKFRQIAAGDRLRQQYHQLSADPNSLSNLDQDLPNNMQAVLPLHSLPQEWLWCETWCSDESLKDARTIDLCNNPQTKEPKLDRARRQVPEWTDYDNEIAAVLKKAKETVGVAEKSEGVNVQEQEQEQLAAHESSQKAAASTIAGGRDEL